MASPFPVFLKTMSVCSYDSLSVGKKTHLVHIGLLLASATRSCHKRLVQFLGPPSSGVFCGVMLLSMRLKSLAEVSSKGTHDLLKMTYVLSSLRLWFMEFLETSMVPDQSWYWINSYILVLLIIIFL